MTERTLHLIGNAHIDPVWLWQWPEGFEEVRATFRAALELMDEDPDMRFTADSAAYYAWIEEIDPAMFERIRQRVAEGRWEIAGGMWVEPDCNLPSGESFVRHVLVSQRFFRSRFGRTPRIGLNVDPFGHNLGLPQILRLGGMDAYVFMRPGPHEKALPAPMFRWRSPDGAEVLGLRIPHEYCTPREELEEHLERVLEQLPPEWSSFIAFYGVGNHGGGPTRANLASIRRLSGRAGGPRLVIDTIERFVDAEARAAAPHAPLVADDLQHHAVGCYAAHSGIKRWNRRAESLLLAAEGWAAVASAVAGTTYPAADLDRAWKNVLFNQFHDILAGTSIEPAYEEARDQLGEASAIAARALNLAIQSIASRIDLPPLVSGAPVPPAGTPIDQPIDQPIVAFNVLPWLVRAAVELEFGGFEADDALCDEEGRPVAVQETQSYATASASRRRIVFEAELPPTGYRTYRVVRGGARVPGTGVQAGPSWIANDRLRLRVDAANGRISELVVRRDGRDVAELADRSRPRAVVVDDTSDTWGHGRVAYHDVVGGFTVRRVEVVERGPVRAILRVVSAFGASELTEDFVLSAGADHVTWRVLLDWQERARLLKLRVPTRLRDAVPTYEVPYAAIVRLQDGEEKPGQRWVDLTGALDGLDEPCGVAVLNDGKYGFDVVDGSIGVTAVRSPIYAHHDPAVASPGVRYQYQDVGFQRFTLALLPHLGPWETAGVPRRAVELNVHPTTLLESPHPGSLPSVASFASASSPDVILGALKLAEDGSGDAVIRLVDATGLGGPGFVELPAFERGFAAEVGPWQIRTWRVPRGAGAPWEVDLLEEPLERLGFRRERRAMPREAVAASPPVADPDRPETG